jgi:hypothetical protein
MVKLGWKFVSFNHDSCSKYLAVKLWLVDEMDADAIILHL